MKKLLILDRDGTIIVEPPEDYQVDSLEKLAFLPGVIGQLIKINAAHDFEWVMVTNQDGLGTEVYPEETFWPPHQKMMDLLEGEGIHFSEVIIDRTFKKDGAPTRKPGTALLTKYLEGEYDLANSFVIGDRLSDIKLAQNLGAKGILIGRSADTIDDDYTAEELVDTLVLEAQHWAEISAFMSRNAISRAAVVERKTQETDIRVAVNLDGTGQGDHQTGIGFFDHMLDQLGRHSQMDLSVHVKGDLHIDPHHSIEDAGIALGQAIKQALGDKRGIERYGCFTLVMDEARAEVALDFSGRAWLNWEGKIQREKVGEMPVEMVEHFFWSFCEQAGCTMHIVFSGRNAHHIIEAIFKGVARAIRLAVSQIPGNDQLPSTKGVL